MPIRRYGSSIEIGHQHWLIDLNPLHAFLCKSLQDFDISTNQFGKHGERIKVISALAQQQKSQGPDKYWARLKAESASFTNFHQKFGRIDLERDPFGPLRDQIVVVCVEPLGHLHSRLFAAIASHGEVTLKGYRSATEPFRRSSNEHQGIEDLIVE